MSVFVFIVLIVALVTCGDVVSRWLASSGTRRELPDAGPELERLRERVESLTSQVERLEAEQRFMTRLLEDRTEPVRDKNHHETQDANGW